MSAVIEISDGFEKSEAAAAARLFWNAFNVKLGSTLGPSDKALVFVERVLNPKFALCARLSGKLVGLAGYKTSKGQLINGGWNDIAAVYGWFSGLWRVAILSLLERNLREGQFLMDGIFVDPEARGKGVGTKLLSAIKDKAQEADCHSVRLDVIDTNPRAKKLYERQGFVAVGESSTGVFKHLFKFSSATTMEYKVSDNAEGSKK